jgi:hypothetical protein
VIADPRRDAVSTGIGRHSKQLGKGDSVMLRLPCPRPPWFGKT